MVRNEELDNLFCFLMKCFLRTQRDGLLGLKVDIENESEVISQFIGKAIELIQDGQCPIIIDTILTTEIQYLLSNNQLSRDEITKLNIVKRVMVWIQDNNIDPFFEYSNLWSNMANRYASFTFYPNLPLEVLRRNGLIDSNIVPEHMLEKENY